MTPNAFAEGETVLPPGDQPPPASPLAPPAYLGKYAGQMEGVGEDQRKAYGEYQSALAKPMSALSRINATPPPAPPQQEKVAPAPHANANGKDAMAFASAMAVLGAVASRFTRVPGQAALGAFAGAMKGWQEGNREAYEASAHEWEQNTKKTIDNNKMVLDKYKEVLANRQMNIDQQMSQIQLLAAQYQDRMTFDAAAAKNYTMVAQIYEKSHEATQKAQTAFEALQAKRAADAAKHGKFFSDSSIDMMAEARMRGDKSVLQGLGTGMQKAETLGRIYDAIEQKASARGMPRDFLAQVDAEFSGMMREEAAVGQRAGAIAIAVKESKETIPAVMAAAQKSAGRGYAHWNAVKNAWEREKGDEDFARYVTLTNSLINLYGRVISGGGKGTVSDLEHAREMLNPNMPFSAFKGAISGIETEIGIAERAPQKVREDLRRETGASDSHFETPGGGPTKVASPADAEKLAPGTHYVTPDGQEFTR